MSSKDFVSPLLEAKDPGESSGIDVKAADRSAGVKDDWSVFPAILPMAFICKFRGRSGFEGFWVFSSVSGFNSGEAEMVVNFPSSSDGKATSGFLVSAVKSDSTFGSSLIILCVKECSLSFA